MSPYSAKKLDMYINMQNQYRQKIIKISHLIKHLQNEFTLFLIVICYFFTKKQKKWKKTRKNY